MNGSGVVSAGHPAMAPSSAAVLSPGALAPCSRMAHRSTARAVPAHRRVGCHRIAEKEYLADAPAPSRARLRGPLASVGCPPAGGCVASLGRRAHRAHP